MVVKWKCLIALLVVVLLITCCDARKRKSKAKTKGSMILRQKETNAIDFIRLAVMRLIYGIATRIGFGEQISEVLNGAFVPPGAEDDYDDYGGGGGGGGFDLLDREDDYDY